MKNKNAILLFISVAIICVTSLIIWNDLKKSITEVKELNKSRVEKIDDEQIRERALARIHREFELQNSNCFYDRQNKELWARIDLDLHQSIKCSIDTARQIKGEVVEFLKDKIRPAMVHY